MSNLTENGVVTGTNTAITEDLTDTLALKFFGVAGAVAGDHTCTGIASGDTLVSVLRVATTAGAVTGITEDVAEYTTGTNKVNNSGGTSSAGGFLIIVYKA